MSVSRSKLNDLYQMMPPAGFNCIESSENCLYFTMKEIGNSGCWSKVQDKNKKNANFVFTCDGNCAAIP